LCKIVIDLHCHLLPGIDDGPATIEASVALARAAVAAGTRTLVATPHVSWRYPNDRETIARLVDELQKRLALEGVGIELHPGAEIAITQLIDMDAAQLRGLGLGGGPWLLVEPPFMPFATGVDTILLELQDQGHGVVLAHPERCPTFQRDPQMLESLVRGGILTSITAGALAGRFGGVVRRFALELVRDDMVHNVASDAHDLDQRRPGIAADLKQAGLDPLADWLTHQVPAAILNGEETMPPRPEVELQVTRITRRRWWRRGPLRQAS
jgi:protein-tyrosine phosphatase